MRILVTGGSGFIGSALIRKIISETDYEVVNLDDLTYSSVKNVHNNLFGNKRYIFEKGNVCDKIFLYDLFDKYKPNIVMHLAAETHVDNSISGPEKFLQTNIIGTYSLLEVCMKYWKGLKKTNHNQFKFLQVSTDEVFGDLELNDKKFSECHPYNPSSPYAATKASADHLVRAWGRTFNFPYLISNCSNNFGPFQHPEKLIPKIILNALKGLKIPIYGNGMQIRDWLFVDDHADALLCIIKKSPLKESYNIGTNNELTNIEITHLICEILDNLYPKKNVKLKSYKDLIIHVNDRLGHDKRYAIDASKIYNNLKWKPSHNFSERLKQTVKWYVDNQLMF